MLNLPILERIEISHYGLFPGTSERPWLDVELRPGLTLVLGANGLGKSTLISILYRLLAGPYDIPGLISGLELGNARLEAKPISASSRSAFSARVADGAASATARVSLRLGPHAVVIARRLRDLSLIQFTVDGTAHGTDEEAAYQPEIARLVGVWSFGDWILLLRHLVFYFEDRRALVWDASAQRQIFRILFLTPDTARTWTENERAILELDSYIRNLSATLTREERSMTATEIKTQSVATVREELSSLAHLQDIDSKALAQAEDDLVDLDSRRESARLRLLTVEQEREHRFRELERARLVAISARFPSRSETARYIVSQLLTDAECLVCGNRSPAAVDSYAARISNGHCVICDSTLAASNDVPAPVEMADARVTAIEEALDHIRGELTSAEYEADAASRQYDRCCETLGRLNTALAARSNRIDSLVKQLPPAEAAIHEQRKELTNLRGRVALLKADVLSKRETFRLFVEDVGQAILAQSEEVKTRFHEAASGFLLEQCRLVWAPRKARLGESGETIMFPAFELEMTGTDFTTAVRRTGPDQVSESQREFIDLAFRMSLIAVAAQMGSSTMVIDAPEASLDSVFAARAATVLARFSRQTLDNRLIVTSNLVEGTLIPELLAKAVPEGEARAHRVLDLLTVAVPTAAVRALSTEYASLRDQLIADPPA
jgi:predicted  nucleic acid-binding Zn-ribbon protein